MDNIRQRFDQTLAGHLERLLGTQSGVADLPYNLLNISLVIFLAEQAANMRDQMISADDRYTRKALYTELAEIGLGSKPHFYQAIDDMFNRAYLFEDDSGRLMAGEALIEMAQLLDSVLPNMPGLSLIAYVAQTLDEAVSGRKTLEDAVSQFDQTLSLHGVCLTNTQDPTPEQDKPKEKFDKKRTSVAISNEVSKRLIKSRRQQVECEPTRQSKVLSSKNQMQIKPVAFGKVEEVAEADPEKIQEQAVTPGPTEEVQDPDNKEEGMADIDAEVPSEAILESDIDVPAVEIESQDDRHLKSFASENDLANTEPSPEKSAVGKNPSAPLEHDPSEIDTLVGESNPASVPQNEDLQAPQSPIQADATRPDQLDPIDEAIEEEINRFETDLAMQCPICKSARIIAELTTKGKEYYKCPNKSCNFVSWGKPFHNECPRCHNPFLIEAQKNGVIVLKCPRATCNYWQGGSETRDPSQHNSKTQMRSSKPVKPKRRRRVVKRRVVRRKK